MRALVLAVLVACAPPSDEPAGDPCRYFGEPYDECTTTTKDGIQTTICRTITPCRTCVGDDHVGSICIINDGEKVFPCMERCPDPEDPPQPDAHVVSVVDAGPTYDARPFAWGGVWDVRIDCQEDASAVFVDRLRIQSDETDKPISVYYWSLNGALDCTGVFLSCDFDTVVPADVVCVQDDDYWTDNCVDRIRLERDGPNNIKSTFIWLDRSPDDPAQCTLVGTPE